MNRVTKLLLAATCLLVACDKADHRASAADAKTIASDDEQRARASMARWLQVIQGKDAQAIASFYTDDAVLMAPGQPMVSGQDAVHRFWQSSVNIPSMTLSLKPEVIEFSGAGDIAIDRGTYHFSGKQGGKSLEESGKYVLIWKKVSGTWKVAADIWNSDTPSPA